MTTGEATTRANLPTPSGSPRRDGLVMVAAVASAATAARAIYWAVITPTWSPQGDADQYVRLARALANGDGFSLVYPQMEMHPSGFRPPLYPALLAPGAWLFGDALWPIRLVNLILGVLVAVLTALLTRRILERSLNRQPEAGSGLAGLEGSTVNGPWGRLALFGAGVAGLAVAFYPPLLANDTVSLTEPLALALILAAILLVDDERWVWAGATTGLLLLTRPNGYLVVAILAAFVWHRIGLGRAVRFMAVAGLVLLPWLIRNEIQVGTFRPTTSDGLTLAAVYAPRAQEAHTFVDPVFSPAYENFEDRIAQFDEAKWSSKLTRDGFRGIKSNPGYVAEVVRRNFRGYFEITPSLNEYPEVNDGRDMNFRDLTLPLFYVVSVVGLLGLWQFRGNKLVWVIAALTAQFVLVSLLLVAPPRLRAPFDLACCIGVGLAASWLLGKLRPGPGPDPVQQEQPALQG